MTEFERKFRSRAGRTRNGGGGGSGRGLKTLSPRQRAARAKDRARRKREEADKDKPTAAMLAIPTPDKKMSSAATATATRSDVTKAREATSGPNARPQKPVAPPTAPKSDLKSSGTSTTPKGDIRTPTAAIVGEKSTDVKGAKNNPKTVGEAKKRKSDTFIGKDGKKKAAVTAEELKASGLSLREFLNKRNKARKPVKKNMGGKVKAYKSGGMAKGPMKKNMGGKVMGYKAGGGVTSRGTGKARKTNSCTMVKMKGS